MTEKESHQEEPLNERTGTVNPTGQTSLREIIPIVASFLNIIFLVITLLPIFKTSSITNTTVVIISVLFLVIIGFLGFTIRNNLKIEFRNRKLLLLSAVSLVTLTVLYILWIGNWIKYVDSNQCVIYGLQITSHESGAVVDHEKVEVWGTYEKEPKGVGILLINESTSGLGYWPSAPVEIDQTKKEWRGVVYLSGTPPIQAKIVIATMGKSGSVLYDYYQQVARMTDEYIAIRLLTEDIDKCQDVSIVRTK